MTRIAALALVLAFGCAGAGAAERMTIGFADIMDDPRHADRLGFGGIVIEQRGRAYEGAVLAMRDIASVAGTLGIEFELVGARAQSPTALAEEIEKLRSERGARFILVDAATDSLSGAARS